MDIPAPEMILLIGIPASGKSTFYRQRFAETHLRRDLRCCRIAGTGKLSALVSAAGR